MQGASLVCLCLHATMAGHAGEGQGREHFVTGRRIRERIIKLCLFPTDPEKRDPPAAARVCVLLVLVLLTVPPSHFADCGGDIVHKNTALFFKAIIRA